MFTSILLFSHCGPALSHARIVLRDLPCVVAGSAIQGNVERHTLYDALRANESYSSTFNAGRFGHVGSRSMLVVFVTTAQFYRRAFGSFAPDVAAPGASKPPQPTRVARVGQACRGAFAGGAGGKFSPVGFRPESNHDELSLHAATSFHRGSGRQELKVLP